MPIVRTLATARVSALILTFILVGCGPSNHVTPNPEMPQAIIWAWERPEDLRFLDPAKYGVAFLAQTLFLEKERVDQKARRQPLEVAPGTYLIAVTRIETTKTTEGRPELSDEQIRKINGLVMRTLQLPDVRAVQIDFDAVVSERDFYRRLMKDLRSELDRAGKAVRIPLTMTSLASWCTGDAWFNDFPVDEAVPMVFVMGADSEKVRNYLRNGNDWIEPLCRGSYGISVDEPKLENIRPERRMFYFKNAAWTKSDLERF